MVEEESKEWQGKRKNLLSKLLLDSTAFMLKKAGSTSSSYLPNQDKVTIYWQVKNTGSDSWHVDT